MQHLAIIPDGNRRWALAHKLETFLGHKKGLEGVKTAASTCIKNNIPHLSFYAFSIENFKRSEVEKNYLFHQILSKGVQQNLPELIDQDIKIRFIGDQSMFPESIKDAIQEVELKTAHAKTLSMNLLFCYGAQQEITQATKKIAQLVQQGLLAPEDITEHTVTNALWTAGIPNPDLIIRTGGVSRLSNYLLFQAAYSEFSFLDCLWPDITQERLEQCIHEFDGVQRNFGT